VPNNHLANITKNDLRHLNVYAEVRGKYARPPPANQQKTEIPLLTPKENSIISRPSTAGSLRPRSHSYKQSPSNVQPAPKTEEKHQVQPYKKRYRSVNPSETPKSRQIDRVSFEKHEEAPEANLKKNEPDHSEGLQEDYDELLDQVEDLQDNPEDFRDQGSQITTSSQRRYILELESLLREEKMKRYQLEESLKKVIEEKH